MTVSGAAVTTVPVPVRAPLLVMKAPAIEALWCTAIVWIVVLAHRDATSLATIVDAAKMQVAGVFAFSTLGVIIALVECISIRTSSRRVIFVATSIACFSERAVIVVVNLVTGVIAVPNWSPDVDT